MTTPHTILIIDDIEENIDILKRQLIKKEYNVLTARDGAKGIRILKEQQVDLILLDINMPVIDGITLLGDIRKDQTLNHIAILMVTGNDDITMALKCLKKGACGYITKPYSLKQITQQIDHCFK